MSEASTGFPAAIASRSVTPKLAIRAGAQYTSAVAYQSGRSSRTRPAKTTSSAISRGTMAR